MMMCYTNRRLLYFTYCTARWILWCFVNFCKFWVFRLRTH